MKPARRKQISAILGEGRCSLCGGVLTLVTIAVVLRRRVREASQEDVEHPVDLLRE